MTLDDLSSYQGEWREPAKSQYTATTSMSCRLRPRIGRRSRCLNILEACVPRWVPGETLASLGPRSPLYWHLLVEAKKLAYSDLHAFNGDPNFTQVPLQRLLSGEYAASLCDHVDPRHASVPWPPGNRQRRWRHHRTGNRRQRGQHGVVVSSNYEEFGSGITVPGYGFIFTIAAPCSRWTRRARMRLRRINAPTTPCRPASSCTMARR